MATRTFATFNLDDLSFGVDILVIREINKHLEMTPVQHAAEHIRGLVNIRGQIVTVVDLKRLLGIGKTELSPLCHNVILKTEGELASLRDREGRDDISSSSDKVSWLVDEIGDIIAIQEDEIDTPPANMSSIDGKYLSGVVKLKDRLIALLNVSTVLEG